jgi:hypothetical protein
MLPPDSRRRESLYGDAASVALLFATETDLSPSTVHMLVLRWRALLGSLPSIHHMRVKGFTYSPTAPESDLDVNAQKGALPASIIQRHAKADQASNSSKPSSRAGPWT